MMQLFGRTARAGHKHNM